MVPGLRQFGRFLLIEEMGDGRFGKIWRAVRMETQGVEHLFLQKLAVGLTKSETFVQDLASAVQAAVDAPRDAQCPVFELGVVGPQHYLAGRLPEGQTLQRFLDRCATLNLPVPAALIVDIAIQCLKVLAPLGHDRASPTWFGAFELDNLWLGYDGRVSLGWDGLALLGSNRASSPQVFAQRGAARVVDMLGNALVGGRPSAAASALPTGLSEWLRTALGTAENTVDVNALIVDLETLTPSMRDEDRRFVETVFSRDRAVDAARADSANRQIKAMPMGARKVIARAAAQVLINHQRERAVVKVEHVPDVTPPSDALFHGDLKGLDVSRLLYRYAVARVNGRLDVQGPPGTVSIEWQDGQVRRVRAVARGQCLKTFIIGKEIATKEELSEVGATTWHNEGSLVQTIVQTGRVGHHEVLEAFQAYCRQTLTDLVGRERGAYVFVGEAGEASFSYGPTTSLYAIINEGLMSRVSADRFTAFIRPKLGHRLQRMTHHHITTGDLRLTTRQLRVWNAVESGSTVDGQLLRLTAIPGVDRDYACRVLTMMERMDFVRFDEP